MKKIFYGWWVVLASFFTLFVSVGIGFNSLPVFLEPVSADTGWGVGSLSNAGAIASLAAGFATPAVGYAVDRYGARAVMIPGTLIVSASIMFMGRVTSINQMYLLFLFMGIGLAMTTLIPTHTLVSRWFEKKRGRAMGIVTMGGALGGMVWMPVMNLMVERAGWRGAYEVLGIIVAVVSLPLAIFVIRSSPQSMGLEVDGESSPKDEEEIGSARGSGYDLGQVVKTSSFWLILCASFFAVFAGSGFGLHIIRFLSKSGLSSGMAAAVWSATLGMSIAGRFVFGYFSENRQKRFFAATADIVRTASIVLLVLFAIGIVPLWLAVAQLIVIYGLLLGCSAVIGPLLLAETFGVKAFGKIMGALGIPFTIGMALGQVAGGYLYSMNENYNVAFMVFAVTLFIGGVSISLAKPLFLLENRSAE